MTVPPSEVEAPLARRYALLAQTLDALPDPIVILAAGAPVLRNARARRLLEGAPGQTAAAARAVEMNALLVDACLAPRHRAAREGRGPDEAGGDDALARREVTLVDPADGDELHFEVVERPLPGGPADDDARLVMLRDVTELRTAALELERQVARVSRAEAEARRERDRLDVVLEHAADPILVTDDHARPLLLNRQAEALFHFGRAAGEAPAWASANDACVAAFLTDFLLAGEPARHRRLTLARPDGEPLPAEIVASRIEDRRGGPTVVVAVLHDLTPHARNERLVEELRGFSDQLEQRVRAATADLERQNARLQWQSRELEKASRLKSEFLASMSHELRTPINALLGYTALMLDRIYGELTPRQVDGLDRIQAAARHLLELINDILDLARIEAGKMPVHLEPVELGPLLEQVMRQVEPLLQRKAVTFRTDLAPDVPEMHTDAIKVKQILLNLLSNAAKFTHEGEVRLTVRRAGNRVEFEVRDTGIGIRDQDLASIWEDFRQVDQSRTREYGGTGLGLSITRKLVQRLDGDIDVRSRPGEGSTFTVTLPVRSPAHVVDAFGRDAHRLVDPYA